MARRQRSPEGLPAGNTTTNRVPEHDDELSYRLARWEVVLNYPLTARDREIERRLVAVIERCRKRGEAA